MINLITLTSIIAHCIAIIWLLRFNKIIPLEIRRHLSVLLFFLAYNQLVLLGYDISFLHQTSVMLTYTDALTFYLIAPLFYLLVVHLVENRPFFVYKNTFHLWPMLVGLVYMINFNAQPDNLKDYYAKADQCGILPDWPLYVNGLLSTMFYVLLSMKVIRKFLNDNGKSIKHESFKMLNSLFWFLALTVLLGVAFGILLTFSPLSALIHFVMLPILLCVSVMFLYLILFIKPTSLQYNKWVELNNKANNHKVAELENKDFILETVSSFMVVNKPYLKHSFDLTQLSKSLKIPEYKISACINSVYSITVPDFINSYRINHAKNLLKGNYKVDYIAYECGFSSRSNFYVAFKRFTDLTPSEYKSQLKNSTELENAESI
jgi:AraC-like DNA-binding protein